ncbi:hypothetical protein BSKO_01046 [Bryopsis sp. KO-2023]|nr:hypothetical protein BSKO_01046 [Bryopsis sp. KO-2023]
MLLEPQFHSEGAFDDSRGCLSMDREHLLCLNKWLGYDDETDLRKFEAAVLSAVSLALPPQVRTCIGPKAQVPALIYGGLLGPPEVANSVISAAASSLGVDAKGSSDASQELYGKADSLSTPFQIKGSNVVENGGLVGDSLSKPVASNAKSGTSTPQKADKPLTSMGGSNEDFDVKTTGEAMPFSNEVGFMGLLFFALLSHLCQSFFADRVWLQLFAALGMIFMLVWFLGAVPERLLAYRLSPYAKVPLLGALIGLEVILPLYPELQCDLLTAMGGVVVLGLIFLSYTEPVLTRLITQTSALGTTLVRAYLPCLGLLSQSDNSGKCMLSAVVMLSLALGLTFSGMLRALARYTGHKRAGFTWRTKEGMPLSKLRHKG